MKTTQSYWWINYINWNYTEREQRMWPIKLCVLFICINDLLHINDLLRTSNYKFSAVGYMMHTFLPTVRVRQW